MGSEGLEGFDNQLDYLINQLLDLSSGDYQKAGRIFEKFVKKYLKIHPFWGKKFSEIWLWKQYPKRGNRIDTGIDLVALDEDSNYWALQVKFYPKGKITHRDISTFIAAATPDEFKHQMLVYLGELTKEAEETLLKNKVWILDIGDELEVIDWSKFSWSKPEEIHLKRKKELRPYQRKAIEKTIEGFKTHNRGKLIMAPGTGKTFTALKLTEKLVGKDGTVLFLVPSIALADQTLRAWLNDSDIPINPYVVTSDKSIGKSEDEITKPLLTVPPTTKPEELMKNFKEDPNALNVIISTYQSLDVIETAQKEYGLGEFNLIICDEAHYTTGLADPKSEKTSPFKKVHHNEFVKGKKRLYMTATPKIFHINLKQRAKQEELVIYDMSDPEIYGSTFFEYTFYKAVQEGYLTDYRVVVFTVPEREVQEKLFDYLQSGNAQVEETAKMFGTLKVLEGEVKGINGIDIKRSVIFVSNIRRSKKVTKELPKVANEIDSSLNVAIKHIDGKMTASERKQLLDWLREGPQNGEDVRALTNARVLTEGIDVPALDSVVFFDPRKSTVDIVQAMGRVMRKAPGKRYGYIVLPVIVQSDKPIEEQLNENKDFQTVWQLAAALRTLDESFTARVRQIVIKQNRYEEKQTAYGGIEGKEIYYRGGDYQPSDDDVLMIETSDGIDPQLKEALKRTLIPRVVEKVGGKKYLENWAKDVAKKVKRIKEQIDIALKKDESIRKDFQEFLKALREIINPSITEEEAKSLLVQHMITKPIFEALFGEYDFLKDNPVAQTIEKVVSHFTEFLKAETEDLEEFYREVRIRAKGISEVERQDFLRQLYDSFFKIAFPDIADKLGIVYTPVELIDFLINSVEEILKEDFNSSLNNSEIKILEPFAGTGTFIARLMHFLNTEDLKRKYTQGEIWANEILLLAYYIALANVESVYYEKTKEYKPFKYLLLTDTFQLYEKSKTGFQRTLGFFPKDYTDLMEQETKETIKVIISNPPWRVGQKDMTDLNMSNKYPALDGRIKKTYADKSQARNKNALYDAYVRAVRFASDRIGERGIIAFVLNNGFIDANAFDGFRKALVEEFKKIYVFNLRGNARKQGEEWKKEGDKIFGQGSRAGVALLILIKDKKEKNEPAKVYYYQVPDYLKRQQKLELLKKFKSVKNVPWVEIKPDEQGNWINQGSEEFKKFTSIEEIFEVVSLGITTGRDYWVYDFSKEKLKEKVQKMIETYNDQLEKVQKGVIKKKEDLTTDKTKISWSESLIKAIFSDKAGKTSLEKVGSILKASYRPFIDLWIYFSDLFIHRPTMFPQIFPTPSAENVVMFFTGTGVNKDFAVLITNHIVEYGSLGNTVAIPLYLYQPVEAKTKKKTLFGDEIGTAPIVELEGKKYHKKVNIKQEFLKKLGVRYNTKIEPEELYHYVFSVLSNPEYGQKYANNLKRERPRIPFPKDYETFKKLSELGIKLAELQLNYWDLEEYPLKVEINPECEPRGEETYYPRLKFDKNKPIELKYNDCITIKGIPEEAYRWKLAGRSPIEWIAEYCKPRTHRDSGITIDPADYIKETGDKEYFIRLIKQAVKVSLEIQKILREFPDWEDLKKETAEAKEIEN